MTARSDPDAVYESLTQRRLCDALVTDFESRLRALGIDDGPTVRTSPRCAAICRPDGEITLEMTDHADGLQIEAYIAIDSLGAGQTVRTVADWDHYWGFIERLLDQRRIDSPADTEDH